VCVVDHADLRWAQAMALLREQAELATSANAAALLNRC